MQLEFSERNIFHEVDNSSIDLNLKADRLFEDQIKEWKLAADGYNSLKSVQIKKFDFENFSIEAHYNPGRIISSSAKVDAKSINERPCFLCFKNLPQEQKALKIYKDFILLVNPFPIFEKHFTIPSINHTPQLIESEFENMLIISSMLGKNYSVFYNGPKCGASAPDHLHFQAGNFGFMKIDKDFDVIKKIFGKLIINEEDLLITVTVGFMRNFISLESKNIDSLVSAFNKIYVLLSENNDEEPMLNIICSYNQGWRVIIFPRTRHRPSYFFEDGENQILISPAAVDLGGVLIFPREKDFEKVNRELIVDIFKQVTYSNEYFSAFSEKLIQIKN